MAESLVQFFKPATTFIARWLPVFFVPSLVVLPLALQGLSSGQMISVLTITVVGMVVSCAFTAQTAVVIRKFLHPILSCAIGGELAVLTVSTYTGQSFFETLALYKVTSGVSAGTALLFCLGSVILSFAFQMYSRRKLMMVSKQF